MNNDASNQNEFLLSLQSKREKQPASDEDFVMGTSDTPSENERVPPSCARADAKFIDRTKHTKYDIAKNEDGPLRRTTRSASKAKSTRDSPVSLESERLKTIESHLAVKYGTKSYFFLSMLVFLLLI